MDDNQILFWVNLRASLIQEANDLQKLRAVKLQLAETVKRLLDDETGKDKQNEIK